MMHPINNNRQLAKFLALVIALTCLQLSKKKKKFIDLLSLH